MPFIIFIPQRREVLWWPQNGDCTNRNQVYINAQFKSCSIRLWLRWPRARQSAVENTRNKNSLYYFRVHLKYTFGVCLKDKSTKFEQTGCHTHALWSSSNNEVPLTWIGYLHTHGCRKCIIQKRVIMHTSCKCYLFSSPSMTIIHSSIHPSILLTTYSF